MEDTVAVLWEPRVAATRGPKPSIDLTKIIDIALMLADRDGMRAVTMERVARELGVTKMALYRHVPGKQQLVAVMIDDAVGPPPFEQANSQNWRPGLDEWAQALRGVFQSRPWLLEVTIGPRVMGPNEMGWFDRAVSQLEGTGLTGHERLDVVGLVSGHVRTMVEQTRVGGAGSPTTGTAFLEPVTNLIRGREGRYPALAAALSDVSHRTDGFQFGLDRILDGLEALITSRKT